MIRVLCGFNHLIRSDVSVSRVISSEVHHLSPITQRLSPQEEHQLSFPLKKKFQSIVMANLHSRQFSCLSNTSVDSFQRWPSLMLCVSSSTRCSNGSDPLALYRPRHFSTSTVVRNPTPAAAFLSVVDKIRRIENPKLRKLGWSALALGVIGLVGGGVCIARIIDNERSAEDISIGQSLPLSEEIKDLQNFIKDFNQLVQTNPTRIEDKQIEAFRKIQYWFMIGHLCPRVDSSQPNYILAMQGLLELVECNDFDIRLEALNGVIEILRLPLDYSEQIGTLCCLIESKISKLIVGEKKEGSDVAEKETAVMEALVTAYRLVLLRIYHLCENRKRTLKSRKKIEKRAHNIGLKLKNNIAFQYQAGAAQSIAKSLPITYQPVTKLLEFLEEIINLFLGLEKDVRPLLNQEMMTIKFIEDSIKLIKRSPDYYEKVDAALDKVNEALDLFLEKQKSISSEEFDWVRLYGLVEVLCQLADSPADSTKRIEAFERLISLINDTAPEQILFKIAAFLHSVKNDPLLALEAKKAIERLNPIFLSKCTIEEWNSVIANADSMDKWMRRSKEKTAYKASPGSKIERMFDRPAFQNELVIPQRGVLSSVVKKFQQSSPKDLTTKQVIWGRPGSGKTTFVTDFIRRFGNSYSEIYWINAQNFDTEIGQIANSFGISSEGEEQLNELKRYLKEYSGWLMIVDNADELNRSTLNDIKKIIPNQGGHVLVTTRSSQNNWLGYTAHELDPIHRNESIFYLTTLTSDSDNVLAEKVAVRLEDLPLALSQFIGWFKGGGKSFEEFIDVFDEKKIDLDELFPPEGGALSEEKKSVVVTWWENFNRLKEDSLDAVQLISFLSFVSPKEISYGMMSQWQEQFAPTIGKRGLSTALTELSKRMMIEKPSKKDGIEPTSADIYQIHSLNQEAMRRLLSEEDWVIYVKQAIDYLTSLNQFMNFNPVRQKTFRDFEQLKSHFEALIRHVDFNNDNTLTNLEKLDEYSLEKFQYLANTLFRYHFHNERNYEFAKQCVSYVQKIGGILLKKGSTSKGNLYQAWYHYLEALFCQKLSAEYGRSSIKLGEWKSRKEPLNQTDCKRDILEVLLMVKPFSQDETPINDLIMRAEKTDPISEEKFKEFIFDVVQVLNQESRKNKLASAKEFQSALEKFSNLNEIDFSNHMLESNVEKWNKTYALSICQYGLLVGSLYPRNNPEELSEIFNEFEELRLKFEEAAAESWRNLKESPERWKKEEEKRKWQDKDFETNTFRFDVPRCMGRQAIILKIQGKYSEARELMLEAIEEQKAMYRATVDAEFETTPTSAVSYHTLAEICFEGEDFKAALEYENESRKINMNIFKKETHRYVKRNDEFIKKYKKALENIAES